MGSDMKLTAMITKFIKKNLGGPYIKRHKISQIICGLSEIRRSANDPRIWPWIDWKWVETLEKHLITSTCECQNLIR